MSEPGPNLHRASSRPLLIPMSNRVSDPSWSFTRHFTNNTRLTLTSADGALYASVAHDAWRVPSK